MPSRRNSVNRIPVAAVLRLQRVERCSTLRDIPHEHKPDVRNEPNLILCFQQKLEAKANFYPAQPTRRTTAAGTAT
jgi:hypothetical protein